MGQFTDIREIQQHLKDQGVELESETEDSEAGPANFFLFDPDGCTVSDKVRQFKA